MSIQDELGVIDVSADDYGAECAAGLVVVGADEIGERIAAGRVFAHMCAASAL